MSEPQKLSEIHKRTWTPFFEAILRGDKNGEVRLNDFDVQSGDTLVLDEWNQNTGYTGRSIKRKVRAIFPVDFHQFHSAEEIQKHGHLYIELENPKVEALEAEGRLRRAQNLIPEIANDVKNVRKIIRQTDCPEGWTTPCTECLNEISCERSDLIDRLLKIEAALAGVPCGGAAKQRRG